ncbi:MAG: L,D-transpeptidase family protein [Paracoccaceae bacterium]
MRDTIIVTRQGAWFRGRRYPCSVGRGGITRTKREGDGATPAGEHRIVGILVRRDRLRGPGLGLARAIGPADLWSDDPRDPDYNHAVRAPHPFGHERLRRADPMYDLVLITDWNWPDARPGRGSAIFVHQWRGPRRGTEGCVAFSRKDLAHIARRIGPRTRLLVKA